MKYLIPIAALAIGALAQQEPKPMDRPDIQVKVLPLPSEEPHRPVEEPLILRDPLYERPDNTEDWAMIDEQGINSDERPLPPFEPHERRERPEGKHHRKDRREFERSDQNELMDSEERWNQGPRDKFGGPVRMPGDDGNDERFYNEHEIQEEEDGPRHKGHGKFMKGKGLGHLVFFIILGLLSILLVKKCITKRKDRMRRCPQMPTDPAMIDDQINKHYAEIQRLTEMKNQMQRQIQVEPIIYHQTYPQEMEMGNLSHGRMVNENCYPANSQQIPVGRPVMINNPYNHQQMFRANQF